MSRQFSVIRSDHIEYAFWLIFGRDGSLRMSRGEPAVGVDERAMACSAILPRALFSTPTLKATIKIDDPAPSVFELDVKAAGEALKQTLGLDVDLQIREVSHDE